MAVKSSCFIALTLYVALAMLPSEVELSVTYCVRPDGIKKCPPPQCTATCQNLTYYVSNVANLIKNGTTFLFLPGYHSLHGYLYIKKVSNLRLLAVTDGSFNTNKVIIHCNSAGYGGFTFINVTNLTIQSIQVLYCSQNYQNFAIKMEKVANLAMKNVAIYNTSGIGLLISDIYGYSHIENSTVEDSHGICGQNLGLFCYHDNNSTLSSVLITNSRFLNGNKSWDYDRQKPKCFKPRGSGTASGVFIHIACQARMNITLRNVKIVGNVVAHGPGGNIGVEYISYSPAGDWLVTISILNCTIAHGYSYIGGGIYFNAVQVHAHDRVPQICTCSSNNTVEPRNILTVKDTVFYANKSPYLGAGVYVRLRESLSSVVGKISFINCTFNGHTLHQREGQNHGGVAIHIRSFQLPVFLRHVAPLFEFQFTNCNFTDNFAKSSFPTQIHNGALYVQGIDSVSFISSTIIAVELLLFRVLCFSAELISFVIMLPQEVVVLYSVQGPY